MEERKARPSSTNLKRALSSGRSRLDGALLLLLVELSGKISESRLGDCGWVEENSLSDMLRVVFASQRLPISNFRHLVSAFLVYFGNYHLLIFG